MKERKNELRSSKVFFRTGIFLRSIKQGSSNSCEGFDLEMSCFQMLRDVREKVSQMMVS